MHILFISPGGQSEGNSPSENLIKHIVDNNSDITAEIFTIAYRPIPHDINLKQFDIIWGDMDNGTHLSQAVSLAESADIPCYLHGEWIPPYRIEQGWSEHFNEPTNLKNAWIYHGNIKAMQRADLVSLALETTPGGFDYINQKFGIKFSNRFLRYPACKEYDFFEVPKENAVATIARANDGKKRVDHTLQAIAKSQNKPKFLLIGGKSDMVYEGVNLESKGAWNSDEKVKIFARSKIAVQHWSGIPPAEAIQQKCVVLSYDIPYMRELYGDALIWIEKDDVDALSEAIDYWLTHDVEREQHAEKALNLFLTGKLGVKTESHRASLVVSHLKKLLDEKG